MWDICTVGYYAVTKRKPVICSNTDGPGRHYVKQKSGTEGQILHVFTYIKKSTKLISRSREEKVLTSVFEELGCGGHRGRRDKGAPGRRE